MTIRLMLSIITIQNLHLQKLDVNITLLYNNIKENIYILQWKGFLLLNKENFIYKLKKYLV